jgi:hypothetical protein
MRQVYHDSAYWAATVARLLECSSSESRVTTIRYEDLVGQTESTLRRVCRFIGEPFDDGMLDNRSWQALGATPNQVSAWNRRHLEKTLSPISTTSMAKWKVDLAPTEVAVVEANCARGMAKLGYERNSQGVQQSSSNLRFKIAIASCAAYWKVRGLASVTPANLFPSLQALE